MGGSQGLDEGLWRCRTGSSGHSEWSREGCGADDGLWALSSHRLPPAHGNSAAALPISAAAVIKPDPCSALLSAEVSKSTANGRVVPELFAVRRTAPQLARALRTAPIDRISRAFAASLTEAGHRSGPLYVARTYQESRP